MARPGAGWGWLPSSLGSCRADGAPSSPVCLQDSVLAFWNHGMQGRSLDTNEVSGAQGPGHPAPLSLPLWRGPAGVVSVPLVFQVTQEITDETRIFRVLGAHR